MSIVKEFTIIPIILHILGWIKKLLIIQALGCLIRIAYEECPYHVVTKLGPQGYPGGTRDIERLA